MKKFLLVLFACTLASSAFAQGSRYDNIAIRRLAGNNLQSAPNVTIDVCTSSGAGQPCSPHALIYTDVALSIPGLNPFLADGNGNFGFFAAPGRYVVTITGSGVTPYTLVVTLPCDPSATCAASGQPTFSGGVVTPTIGPSAAQQHTLPAVTSDTFGLLAATQAFTNKTLTSPIVTNPSTTGTDSGAETLVNKTLTSPVINTPTLNGSGGLLTLPAGPDTLVGRATTDTLTNKTLTSPAINMGTLTGLTNGTGLQLFNTATTCTTGASIGAVCTTASITLPVAYADTNYRAICIGLTPTNVPIVQTVTKSNTTFTITIAALTAAAATFTSYDCQATHN